VSSGDALASIRAVAIGGGFLPGCLDRRRLGGPGDHRVRSRRSSPVVAPHACSSAPPGWLSAQWLGLGPRVANVLRRAFRVLTGAAAPAHSGNSATATRRHDPTCVLEPLVGRCERLVSCLLSMRFPKSESGLQTPCRRFDWRVCGYCLPIRKRDLLINALGILMLRGDPGYFRPSLLDTHADSAIWEHMLLIKVLEESHLASHRLSDHRGRVAASRVLPAGRAAYPAIRMAGPRR
jgi:hypothetical protein